MAFSASGRFSSEYHTASSFDPHNEALHSTVAFDENTQGSADMSIEVGRGVKRVAREEELSEDGIFTFGSDQQYEMTGTPPLRPRDASIRKNDSLLRKDATVRKASEAARANESVRRSASFGGRKQGSLADALKGHANNDSTIGDITQPTVTVPARNTRFTRFKQPTANNGARILSGSTLEGSNQENKDPARAKYAQKNTGSHPTDSFLIPDIDGMTALIGGTPAMPRSSKKSSRFTPSASYRMPSRSTAPAHLTLDGVPVPEDAKQVYAGLQQALEKIAQLEAEQAESARNAEDYEAYITELRSQLEVEQRMRRPDSGLGSEDEGAKEKWRRERAQLQTQAKALQERLAKAERQASVQEIAVRRATQERADAHAQLEEVKAENEVFREGYTTLREENEELEEIVTILREENSGLKALVAKAKKSDPTLQMPTKEFQDLTLEMKEKKQKKKKRSSLQQDTTQQSRAGSTQELPDVQTKDFSFSQLDDRARDSIAQLVERELQRIQTTRAKTQLSRHQRASSLASKIDRPRSSIGGQTKPKNGRGMSASSTTRRAVSAPIENSASEAESEDELENATKSRRSIRDMTLPSTTQAQQQQEDDTADLTQLSQATFSASDIRKVLEESRRKNGLKRHSSAPLELEREKSLPQKASQSGVRRKSSLKDITTGLRMDATGRLSLHGENEVQKAMKTVRVQSPQISEDTGNPANKHTEAEDEDVSVMSTASRRRRRAEQEHEEGETSAFIIPDITMHASASAQPDAKIIASSNHKTGECTICTETNGKHIDVPLPVPVSTRELGEDATLRPDWAPHLALAHVLKQLQDEVAHLKLQLAQKEAEYDAHDPAFGRRRRVSVHADILKLTAEVERRSDMVYRLYDVVEGQKANLGSAATEQKTSGAAEQSNAEQEIEETLQSIGMEPAEVAGRIGRSAPDVPEGLQEEYSGDESDELPWEGLSDTE